MLFLLTVFYLILVIFILKVCLSNLCVLLNLNQLNLFNFKEIQYSMAFLINLYCQFLIRNNFQIIPYGLHCNLDNLLMVFNLNFFHYSALFALIFKQYHLQIQHDLILILNLHIPYQPYLLIKVLNFLIFLYSYQISVFWSYLF